MRLDALCTPAAFGLTAAGWSRAQIETAIEWLIDLLDAQDEAAGSVPRTRQEDADRLMENATEMQNPPLPRPVV